MVLIFDSQDTSHLCLREDRKLSPDIYYLDLTLQH